MHGHGHPPLGEVSYSTTSSGRADFQDLFLVSYVAFLTGFFEADLAPTTSVIEIVALVDVDLPDPISIKTGYVPRPPPSLSSIA